MRLLMAAVAMLFFAAANAEIVEAKSSLRLDYTGGSTAQSIVTGNKVAANTSDMLSFDIIVEIGAGGAGEIAFDLQWFGDANIVLESADFETGSLIIPNDPATTANLLTPDAPIFGGGVGLIGNIGWEASEGLLSFSLTNGVSLPMDEVFLGSLIFHVRDGLQSTIELGFFRSEGSSATTPGGSFFTPGFSRFSVKSGLPVPEPGAASLVLLGLAGLWVSGRPTRRASG